MVKVKDTVGEASSGSATAVLKGKWFSTKGSVEADSIVPRQAH